MQIEIHIFESTSSKFIIKYPSDHESVATHTENDAKT